MIPWFLNSQFCSINLLDIIILVTLIVIFSFVVQFNIWKFMYNLILFKKWIFFMVMVNAVLSETCHYPMLSKTCSFNS